MGGFPPPPVITKVAPLWCKPGSPGGPQRNPKNRKPGGGTAHNSDPPCSFLTWEAPISKHFSDPGQGWRRESRGRPPQTPQTAATSVTSWPVLTPHGVHPSGWGGLDPCMCPSKPPFFGFYFNSSRLFVWFFFQKQPFFFPICAGPRHVRAEDTQLGFGCGACAGDVVGDAPPGLTFVPNPFSNWGGGPALDFGGCFAGRGARSPFIPPALTGEAGARGHPRRQVLHGGCRGSRRLPHTAPA